MNGGAKIKESAQVVDNTTREKRKLGKREKTAFLYQERNLLGREENQEKDSLSLLGKSLLGKKDNREKS